MAQGYTLYDEHTAELTERGFDELVDDIVSTICVDSREPSGKSCGSITDGRQSVDCDVSFWLDAANNRVCVEVANLSAWTLDTDGELVCDMSLKFNREIAEIAEIRATAEYRESMEDANYGISRQ